jgi:hypothetical protein
MKRRVAMIEFSIYDQFPLVSGYLHGYARTDPAVAEAFEFVYFTQEVERGSYDETLKAIRALEASVLCFSCYVWNMGLIRRLVADLRHDPAVERIILGGHQITHQIARYVEPADGKTAVINGQGEIPFRALMQRLSDAGDLSGLKGVSFYQDGELWNGGEAEMIANLDDIPSPFLGGLFDRMAHPITVFETNRGCPYKCSFCTWGGDTLKVTKFSLDRIKDELLWIAKKPVMFLSLADANWGMLPRDVEISAYIAQLRKEKGFPLLVYYAAAKNKPRGSVECIEKFHEGGVITSQALGIQSMNPHTLELIDRKNIRNEAFVQMFADLKDRRIDSYGELIWPLPGETLDTLKAGFEQLIELGARTAVMYPAILINNARLTTQVAEHEIEMLACADWKSELQLVKKTKWADRTAVDDGFWFYYAFFLLANCDRDKVLLRYLQTATGRGYAESIAAFADHIRANAATSAYARFIQSIFRDEAHGSLSTIGRIASHFTHDERLNAQSDVARFVVGAAPPAEIARALAVSCLWTLSLPRLFADTPEDVPKLARLFDELGAPHRQRFGALASLQANGRVTELRVNDAGGVWSGVAPLFTREAAGGVIRRIEIRHPPGELPYNRRDANRNYVYAHGMIQRLNHISPSIAVTAARRLTTAPPPAAPRPAPPPASAVLAPA